MLQTFARTPIRIVALSFVLFVASLATPQEAAVDANATVKPTANPTGEQVLEAPHMHTNALINATSPYLLQHAHNPVDWMPWGPEAFAKAKAENKPIFVSIGYSTCYWCHVMERQSFEDEEVAKVMNENYVCVKVDREERPDIDEQLMLATQLMTGRGGWPNSVWLTVDGRPWMTGTYFPKPQFINALEQLSHVWKTQPDNVNRQADSLSGAIRNATNRMSAVATGSAVNGGSDTRPLDRFLAEAEQTFDAKHGGFGDKPKFPPHGALRLLAWSTANPPDAARATSAKRMLTKTLDAMWCGGVHDHVGGGFHRYATDEHWFLPHFEKMLYDNAQLMRAYTEAFVVTGDERYRYVVEDIYVWLQNEMTHPGGGFYSAIDSESEGGEEGRYYTWSHSELVAALGADSARQFAEAYNFESEGNFTEEATGERPGTNIPYLMLENAALSQDTSLQAMRAKLRQTRREREYPHLDDKILTSWNGLMISALARAGDVFQESKYIEAAEGAANFVLENLQRDGKLLRTWRAGQANIPGYLNDYAFFIEGLLELHTASRQRDYLDNAIRLAAQMQEQFEDHSAGGFFFTSAEHEELLLRSKNLGGGGNLPTGNGVAMQVLLSLHVKTRAEAGVSGAYLASARRGLDSFAALMQKAPRQVEHLVLAEEIARELGDSSGTNSMVKTAERPADLTNADANLEVPAFSASLFLSRSQVEPGSSIPIALQLEIRHGYKLVGELESDSAPEEMARPTRIQLPSDSPYELHNIRVPEVESKLDPLLGQRVKVYKDSVWIRAELNTPESGMALGQDTEVAIELIFQACNEEVCFAPETKRLTATIQFAPAAGPLRHKSIFQDEQP